MLRKGLYCVLAAVMILILPAGCGSTSNTASDVSTDKTTTYEGQIKAINGSEITLSIIKDMAFDGQEKDTSGNVPPMESPDNAQNPPAEGSVDATSSATEDTKKADGTPSRQKPDNGENGGLPDSANQSSGNKPLNTTGEEKTFTLQDNTVITIQGNEGWKTGALSDLTVGGIVTVVVSGETVTSVTVLQGGMGGRPDASAPA